MWFHPPQPRKALCSPLTLLWSDNLVLEVAGALSPQAGKNYTQWESSRFHVNQHYQLQTLFGKNVNFLSSIKNIVIYYINFTVVMQVHKI